MTMKAAKVWVDMKIAGKILFMICVQTCRALNWDKVRCAIDMAPMEEGPVPYEQMGRFPWLGIIQHDFYLYGNKRSYKVTGAVRIHVSFALAAAEDMAMINRKTITNGPTCFELVWSSSSGTAIRAKRSTRNTTRFIVWHSPELKYSIGVEDYIMHPEYEDRKTYATTALVELNLVEVDQIRHPAPVLPICLPVKGRPAFDEIYVVRMTGAAEFGDIVKESFSMLVVSYKDCDIFYEKAELDFRMMVPSRPICATTRAPLPACEWDGGAALITRVPDGYWILIGFGVRGPGCGAPARFVDIRNQLDWIDLQISAAT